MLLLFIAAAVLVAAALVVSYPLVFQRLEPHLTATAPEGAEFSHRDALLESLSELELTHRSGKLSDPDYRSQKAQLEKQYLETVGEQK